MEFLNLDGDMHSAVRIAKSLAQEYGNAKYSSAHLLKAMLQKEVGLTNFVSGVCNDLDYLEEWAEIRMEEYEKSAVITDIEPDAKINAVFEKADNIRLKIGLLEFQGFRKLLTAQNMDIELTEAAKKELAFKGFTLKYGARQVSGVVRNYLRRPVSKMIISGKLKSGDILCGDLDEEKNLKWKVKQNSK